MPNNLDKIKAIEIKAKNSIAKAHQDAQNIKHQAFDKAHQSKQNILTQSDKEVAKIWQDVTKKADVEAKQILSDTKGKSAQLEKSMEAKLNRASDYIVRRIIDDSSKS